MIKTLILLLITALSAFATVSVAVSIAPQKYFVQKIAGKDANVTVLVPAGASPATYAPRPSQLKALKDASLYFTIGVPFEQNWLKRFQSINPKLHFIDTTASIQKMPMLEDTHTKEQHDLHEHSGLDPHVWLSPALVKSQAKVIMDALTQLDSAHKQRYHDNYKAFVKEIDTLDGKIKKILSGVKNRTFIVFHPSFGYFAHDYNLTQIAIEKEGKEPSLRYMKRLIDFANKKNIKTIFIAPQFTQKAAKQIASQIHGSVRIIDPLSKDWETNLLNIATNFEKAD